MKIRLAFLSVLVATTAAVTGTVVPAAMATDAGPLATASAAGRQLVPMTTMTLHVVTCDGCPVRLTQSLPGHDIWQSASKKVTGGIVTFTVPTYRTRGLTISVAPRWQTLNAVPLVAFQYAHTTVGQVIPNAVAREKRLGRPCWAGTQAGGVSMIIRVVKYPHRSLSGDPGYAIRVWSRLTRESMRPYLATYRGTVATQAVVTCHA